MAPQTFVELLHSLEECHEEALENLRKDNVQLAQEVYRLKGRPCGRPVCDTASQAGLAQVVPLEHERNDLTAFKFDAAQDPRSLGRHTFPAQIGLPEQQSCHRSRSNSSTRWHSEPMHSEEPSFDRHSFPTLTGIPTELARQSSHRNPELLIRSMSEVSSLARFAVGLGNPAPRGEGGLRINFTPVIHEPTSTSGECDTEDFLAGLPNAVAHKTTAAHGPGMGRGHSYLLDKAVADRHSQSMNRQQQRFRQLLDLRGNVVRPQNIMKVLQKRRVECTIEQAKMVLEELRELHSVPERDSSGVGSSHSSMCCIELESFVQLINVSELQSEERVAPKVLELKKILLSQPLDDVIEKVTKTGVQHTPRVCREETVDAQSTRHVKLLSGLNAIVVTCVVTSITSFGVSMDVAPTWSGWLVLEVIFGTVFVAEVILKIHLSGLGRYLWGPGARWNWFDFGITVITTLDLVLSLALTGSLEGLAGVKLTTMLRAFRLVRIARLVKLLHTPILADLANMLAGFQVGIPCMLWVMVLLFIVFYVVGIILRQLMGPPQGESRIDECGSTGDMLLASPDLMCQPHYLYGEEFFGTLPTSMFTVFRCVLGDCTTEAGKSLTAAFSRGYGIPFDIMYCFGMVLIVVGLFNIIAAIFVETTISGLKFNNVQRKYARTYESRYVQQRLEALITRVRELHREAGYPNFRHDTTDEFTLNEDEFDKIMQDEGVNGILEDLDVAVSNRVGLFDLFDCDNNGLVSITDLVGTLMKIRGEPQKSDMIASWVALRSLNDRFQEFERLVLENQKRLLDGQRELLPK